MNFEGSNRLRPRYHELIPGGAHTYAKGDDQYPEGMAPILVRGEGCRVWDVDGNEFIEYGSGLRAVSLGHAWPSVLSAVHRQLELGTNYVRPARIELECAESFLEVVPGAEMVKFCKDGSDAVSGAVKLARAHTGRDMVAVCRNHPFFAVDDWFIGSTAMPAGIPASTRSLTVQFDYNDLDSLEALFDGNPDRIAAVVLEAEKYTPPAPGWFEGIRRLCDRNGAVFILDEMITGFRWHLGGAQARYDIRPDLSTFGKAMANGFSVSALAGRRELMQLGGLDHDRERVFLLSTTHGAETHGLAAAIATMKVYREAPVIETLWARGERLATGLRTAAADTGVGDHVPILGPPCCLVFGSRDAEGNPSQPFRTLLMQELIERGVLATSLVVSYSHSESDIDRTIGIFGEAFEVYARALEDGVDRHLKGRSVKPAIRPYA
ncbi:MAG: glutamate-1-semialdehyde 2,1-aminomutase [marine benthic group bacterium]|nr:glutamate-1-semialdehyde 2,1-aminomutase [Candidatus Carthagonibacter metallireducens]MCL7969805.1 glutamate-1-semialdehyde 2,1-aminomutase [Gemmatimonadota bacterium]